MVQGGDQKGWPFFIAFSIKEGRFGRIGSQVTMVMDSSS